MRLFYTHSAFDSANEFILTVRTAQMTAEKQLMCDNGDRSIEISM